jgi:hypothetical protein
MSHQLSPDAAATLLVSRVSPNRKPIGIEEASNIAAGHLIRDFAELIAVLPENWPHALRAWLRINGPTGEHIVKDIYSIGAWMEAGLWALLESGKLTPVVNTSESDADIERLRKLVALDKLQPELAVETEAVAAEITEPAPDPVSECVRDYRSLNSTDFRFRWMNRDTRHIYERACAEGRL